MKTNQKSSLVSVPLVDFSRHPSGELFDSRGVTLTTSLFPRIRVQVDIGLPEGCYAVKAGDSSLEPVLPAGAAGLFCWNPRSVAVPLLNIHAVGLRSGEPLIRKLIKNEKTPPPSTQPVDSDQGTPQRFPRRKSFMTPTPLHIPDSEVSPIPESAHQRVILGRIGDNGGLIFVPVEDVLWMHPLIYILKHKE